MRAPVPRPRPILAALFIGWAGCNTTKFTIANNPSDAGPGGSTAGTAGRGGSGGTAGKPVDASTDANDAQAGSAGTAGSGGAPGCASSTCPGGQYCDAITAQCTPCSKVARIHFAGPEELIPIDTASVAELHFARMTGQALELLFRVDNSQADQALYETPNFQASSEAQAFGATVNVAGERTSGPLALTGTGASTKNFFFDRSTSSGTGARQLWWATRASAGIDVSTPVLMPAPFNAAGDNYSIAVAAQAARAWWMSTRGGSPEVFTASLSADAGTAAVVNLTVGSNACIRKGADATPWASPDGTFLLFSSLEQDDAQCTASSNYRDLYVVPLYVTTGQPNSAGIPLNVNQAGVDDTEPSMSADLCWLYYSSAGHLFRAARD